MNDDDRPFWQLAAHCCRSCFGRVLLGESADGQRVYRCAQCGARGDSDDASIVWCCGIRLKTGADAGVRCVVNNASSPECPLEIVAEQACG
jgi:hypothetical protein